MISFHLKIIAIITNTTINGIVGTPKYPIKSPTIKPIAILIIVLLMLLFMFSKRTFINYYKYAPYFDP